MQETNKKYLREGFGGGSVGAMVTLVIGVVVITVIVILGGVLSGQAYNIAEPKIDNISDATIKTYIKDSVKGGFSTLKTTTDYLPLMVLGIVLVVVLGLVLMLGGGFTGGSGGNSAL
ncbi:MAG: hypothetical protein [Siphoviridae sp. ctjeG17]|nr:MAG: hypothetical protein [Siphoviridae sp. ctjeG17]